MDNLRVRINNSDIDIRIDVTLEERQRTFALIGDSHQQNHSFLTHVANYWSELTLGKNFWVE